MVVHRGREAALREEVGGVLPDFGDGVRLGVQGPHVCVPVAPEPHGHLVGHVEPPPVDAVGGVAVAVGVHPARRRVEDVLFGAGVQVGAVGRIGKLGQRLDAPPAFVGKLVRGRRRVVEAFDDVPVFVGRRLALLAQVVEREKVAPGVVEDAVDDDAHPARVRLLDEREEQAVRRRHVPRRRVARLQFHQRKIALGVGPEVRVDVVEGVAVVLVHRPGVEDGVEIQRVDTQILEVVELVNDALEVAAVAPVEDAVLVELRPHRLFPAVARVPVARPRRDTPAFARHDGRFQTRARGVVRWVAVAEALGEDLVPDGIGGPRWHRLAGGIAQRVGHVGVARHVAGGEGEQQKERRKAHQL